MFRHVGVSLFIVGFPPSGDVFGMFKIHSNPFVILLSVFIGEFFLFKGEMWGLVLMDRYGIAGVFF